MTATTKSKITKLHSIILANYTAANESHPEFATQCAMELILKIALGQPKYTDQLLDEEIEDNIKAAIA